jgi:hypothetical protein
MTIAQNLIRCAGKLLLAGATLPLLAGTVTYQYTGDDFTTITGSPTDFSASDCLTITITLDSSETNGEVDSNDWLSWSISGGDLTANSSTSSIEGVESLWGGGSEPAYITLSGGAVVDWDILTVAENASGADFILASCYDGGSCFSSPPAVDVISELYVPSVSASVTTVGVWGEVSNVPEPAAGGLTALGLLLLFSHCGDRALRCQEQALESRDFATTQEFKMETGFVSRRRSDSAS